MKEEHNKPPEQPLSTEAGAVQHLGPPLELSVDNHQPPGSPDEQPTYELQLTDVVEQRRTDCAAVSGREKPPIAADGKPHFDQPSFVLDTYARLRPRDR
jgi:hypothetical protein